MEKVGFIGLGNMGGGMSANIQRAGHPMVVLTCARKPPSPCWREALDWPTRRRRSLS